MLVLLVWLLKPIMLEDTMLPALSERGNVAAARCSRAYSRRSITMAPFLQHGWIWEQEMLEYWTGIFDPLLGRITGSLLGRLTREAWTWLNVERLSLLLIRYVDGEFCQSLGTC